MKTITEIDQEVREACIKANPEIVRLATINDRFCCTDPDCNANEVTYRPITLADVLLAIGTQRLRLYYSAGDDAVFERLMCANVFTHEQAWRNTGERWILTKDWDGQSEETKRFIHSLLA